MKIIHLFFSIFSFIIERVPLLQNLLKSIHFKGKVILVSKINKKYLKSEKFIDSVNGLKYEFNLKDEIQKYIYFNVYERRSWKLVKNYIKKGDICIDVGANVGFYSLNFAKIIGDKGKVFSFEASPNTFQVLKKNIYLNNFENNIYFYDIAISDKKGEVIFSLSDEHDHSGWGHIGYDSRYNSIKVPTTTLDEFLEENNLLNVDFLKVDIEGAEDLLLIGAEKSLKANRIKCVFIEFSGMDEAAINYRIKRFSDFGYSLISPIDVLNEINSGKRFSKSVTDNMLFVLKK
ncbi:MAG: FkbM family methyltransferase [Chloroherpetonaceae bacterium]|nr:FkbM family methyltransferase [Chloroherpetonaceae bacterium]